MLSGPRKLDCGESRSVAGIRCRDHEACDRAHTYGLRRFQVEPLLEAGKPRRLAVVAPPDWFAIDVGEQGHRRAPRDLGGHFAAVFRGSGLWILVASPVWRHAVAGLPRRKVAESVVVEKRLVVG